MVRKYSKLFVLLAILAVTAAACGGDDSGGEIKGQVGGSAIAGLGDPGDLDPAYCGTTTCAEPVGLLFDSLLSYSPQTAALEKKGAAADYKVSADSTVITFTLREGATFHNGEPVDAASFIRGFNRVTVVKKGVTPSELSFHFAGIKGFTEAQAGEATSLAGVKQGASPNELVIELDAPNAEFVVRTGHQAFSPVPASADGADGKPSTAFTVNPVGNGPYQMDGEYRREQGLKVKRWSGYTGAPKGFLDSIEWKVFVGDQAQQNQYLEFQNATLDSADVPPESFADATAKYGKAFVQQPGPILTYLTANTTDKTATGNAKFRQAVSMAINRADIIKAVFNNERVPATSIIPPLTFGHREGVCEFCDFNLERAKQLLTESGVNVANLRVDLPFNADGGHGDWMAAVQAQLKTNLGINARLVPVASFDDYTGSGNDKYLNSKFLQAPALARLGWAQDYPTPDNWLNPLFVSTSGDNHSKYNNPQVDNLISQAQRTLNNSERLKLQQQAEDIIINDMPIIPMWYSKSQLTYSEAKFAAPFTVDLQYGYPAWELVSLKEV
jgi:ABC-type oligopeptide transport system substrate-binding subunit